MITVEVACNHLELRGTAYILARRFDQNKTRNEIDAGIAQLAEQLICNQQVGGSSPSTSSKEGKPYYSLFSTDEMLKPLNGLLQ